jgi:hypothetical protein
MNNAGCGIGYPKPARLYCWRQSTRREVGKFYKFKPGSLTAELLSGRSIDLTLFAAQVFAFSADSMISRPGVGYYEVKVSGPLQTLRAEMPCLATCVCSVFHGEKTFFR